MEVRLKTSERTLIVSVAGDIDHHTAADLKETIDKAIARENIKNILFDFSEVTFMDSSGIGMIIGRYKLVEKKEGIAAICSMPPAIRRIFDITGLGKIIRSYENMDEAVKEIK